MLKGFGISNTTNISNHFQIMYGAGGSIDVDNYDDDYDNDNDDDSADNDDDDVVAL